MPHDHHHDDYERLFIFLPDLEFIPKHQVVEWRAEGVKVQEVLSVPIESKGPFPQILDETTPYGVLFWADPVPAQRATLQATTAWIRAHETNFVLTWQLLDPETADAELLFFIQSTQQPKRRVVIRFALPEWEFAVYNTITATELIFFVCPSPQSPAPHELVNTVVTSTILQKMVRASMHASIAFAPDEKSISGLVHLLTEYAMLNPASRLKDRLLK